MPALATWHEFLDAFARIPKAQQTKCYVSYTRSRMIAPEIASLRSQ